MKIPTDTVEEWENREKLQQCRVIYRVTVYVHAKCAALSFLKTKCIARGGGRELL
jgi:hypothetical protein